MKKLKIFTNHYYPENFRINQLSKQFSKDYQVSVITQIPNYPFGKYFSGYSIFKKRKEIKDNVEIKRLFSIPRGKNNLTLALNYISYFISSFFYALFNRDDVDHVYVYITSPIFVAYSALIYAKRKKVKSTLYLLDIWPDVLVTTLNLKNKFIIKQLEKFCLKVYQRFDNIIVSSLGFIDILEAYGVCRDKITYIPQHADKLYKKPLKLNKIENKLKIVFLGNMGKIQNLDILVNTATILKDSDFTEVLFTMVGDGSYKEELLNKIKNKKVSQYFKFIDTVSYQQLEGILVDNHFAFMSFIDDLILNKTLPAKIQTYMAFGMPIITSSNGEVYNLINKINGGYSIKANNPTALAQLIKKISKISIEEINLMGLNNFKYCNKNFDINNIVKQFLKIMEEV